MPSPSDPSPENRGRRPTVAILSTLALALTAGMGAWLLAGGSPEPPTEAGPRAAVLSGTVGGQEAIFLPEPPSVDRIVTTVASGEADLYVAPSPKGDGDGSAPAHAAGIERLPRLFEDASPGTVIELSADDGPYVVTRPISLGGGGAPGSPVVVRGPAGPARPVFTGGRADPYRVDGEPGSVVFRLKGGTAHVHFAGIHCEDVGNGCFKVVGPVTDLAITDSSGTNVRRFFENGTSREGRDASIDGLTLAGIEVGGYSKGAIRLGHETRNVLIAGVRGDSLGQDGDNFAMGIQLADRVRDVVIRDTHMANSLDTTHEYWNGDGFSAERGVTRLHLIDTTATGNSDAGYDLKSSETLLDGSVASDNKRNFRIWGSGVAVTRCRALDPRSRGGVGEAAQVQLGEGASAHFSDCDLEDDEPETVVFILDADSSLVASDIRVTRDPASTLSRLGPGALLELEGSPEIAP